MNTWAVIVAMGVITFALRLSFIALLGRWTMPPLVRQTLRFVAPAALAAVAVPELLQVNGRVQMDPGNPRMYAGLLAIVVAWRTRNAWLTILAGMLFLWIWQALSR